MVSASVFLLFVHRQSVITGMSLHSLRNSLGTERYVVVACGWRERFGYRETCVLCTVVESARALCAYLISIFSL